MKKGASLTAALFLMIVVSVSLKAAEKNPKENGAAGITDLSYAIGILFGASLQDMRISEIDYDSVVKGIKDSRSGSTAGMTRDEAVALVKGVIARNQEKLGEENLAKEKKFLLENSRKKGVKTTASGLQYEALREGTGKKPSAEDKVQVHYKGSLLDGTVFDSSIARNQPASFKLNEVIPGWTEGLQLMTVGSRYRLFIPSNLGYGSRTGNGPIPPNSVLIFEVELLSIEQ